MVQGFLLFFLCGPLSHIHLRINICQRVIVITSTNTWYHRSAKEHIPLKFQLYSSFKTQRRNDCTKSGSRVLTFPYLVKTSKLRAKNSNAICLKICSRSTKMAIIECKFSKIFRENVPPHPPKTVTVLILLQTNSGGKSTLKNVKLWCPLPKKFWLRSWHENINFK